MTHKTLYLNLMSLLLVLKSDQTFRASNALHTALEGTV